MLALQAQANEVQKLKLQELERCCSASQGLPLRRPVPLHHPASTRPANATSHKRHLQLEVLELCLAKGEEQHLIVALALPVCQILQAANMGVDAPLDSLPAAQLGVPRRPLPHLQLQQRARLHHHLAQYNSLPANAMSRRQHPLLETMGRRPATTEAATPIAALGPPAPQTPLALHTVAAAPTTGWLLAALQQPHHLPLLPLLSLHPRPQPLPLLQHPQPPQVYTLLPSAI